MFTNDLRSWITVVFFIVLFVPSTATDTIAQGRKSGDRFLALAEPRELVPEFQLNANVGIVGAKRYGSIIALDSSGGFTIVWRDERRGKSSGSVDIYARRYTRAGLALSENFRINRVNFENIRLGRLMSACDAGGNTYVVWEEVRYPQPSTWFLQRISPDGSLDGANQALVSERTLDSRFASIAFSVLPDGRFVFAWNKDGLLMMQRYLKNGLRFGPLAIVNNDQTPLARDQAAFAANASGQHIVVWPVRDSSDAERSGNQHLYARRYSRDGVAEGEPFRVDDDGRPAAQRRVEVNINRAGDVVVAWAVNDFAEVNENNSVYARVHYANKGFVREGFRATVHTPWREFTVHSASIRENRAILLAWNLFDMQTQPLYLLRTDEFGQATAPLTTMKNADVSIHEFSSQTMAVNDENESIVAWTRTSKLPQDIVMQRFAADGSARTDAVPVSDENGAADHIRSELALLPDGFAAVWLDLQRDKPAVRMRIFDRQGRARGPSFAVSDDSSRVRKFAPNIAADAAGNIVIAWIDTRFPEAALFARRYSPRGTPLGAEFTVDSKLGAFGFDARAVDLSCDSAGRFVVAWHAERNDRRQIYARRYTADALPLGDIIAVSDLVDDSYRSLQGVDINNTGDFVITWFDTRPEAAGIYARRYRWTSTAGGREVHVNADLLDGGSSRPDIALAPGGRFVVTWIHGAPEQPSSITPYLRIFAPDDRPLSASVPVDASFTGTHSSTVDYDRDSSFAVVWIDTNRVDQQSSINVQRFGYDAAPIGSPARINGSHDGICLFPDIEWHRESLLTSWTIDAYTGTGSDIRASLLSWAEEPVINTVAGQTAAFHFSLTPNPFQAVAVCRYVLSAQSEVALTLYDVAGRSVRDILREGQGPGEYSRSIDGAMLSPGLYYLRLRVNGRSSVLPVVVGLP